MIAELHGVVSRRHPSGVVLDVGGVGYRVEVSARTQAALPADGSAVRLLIESYIREDQFRLFGFLDAEEQHWFGLLLSVPGVGVKAALAIQGQFDASALTRLMQDGEADALASAPGIGKKLAARVVQELRDKLPESLLAAGAADAGARGISPQQDAVLALRKLGYLGGEAQRIVSAITARTDQPLATAELIRQALQELGR